MLIFKCQVVFDENGFTVTSDRDYGQLTLIIIILSTALLIISSGW